MIFEHESGLRVVVHEIENKQTFEMKGGESGEVILSKELKTESGQSCFAFFSGDSEELDEIGVLATYGRTVKLTRVRN